MLKHMMLDVIGKKLFSKNFLMFFLGEKKFRCEVTFPRAPQAGAQESSYDLRLDGKKQFLSFSFL
jgi:hypothetical protein